MQDEFVVSYELTTEWERELRKCRKILGWEIWLYQFMSCVALYVFLGFVGALLGRLLLSQFSALGSTGGGDVYLGFFVGWLAMLLWSRRIRRLTGLSRKDLYEIGSKVRYEFEPSGFRMTTPTQSWWTGWNLVQDITMSDKALILRTPFSTFVMPLDKLPYSVDETMTTLREWNNAAGIKSA